MSDEQDFSERFREFYQQNCQRLLRYAASQASPYDSAEDLLQAVLLEAVTLLSKDHSKRNYNWETWLFGLIKKRAIDAWRRRFRCPVVLASDIATAENSDIVADAEDEAPLPSEVVEHPDFAQHVQESLRRMKHEKQRRLLELLYFGENAHPTLSEVAAAMNITVDNAKQLHKRAKAVLKESLRVLAQEMNIQTERPDHES
jgi:RNA polymerase sigma factor (sigma-70 family)